MNKAFFLTALPFLLVGCSGSSKGETTADYVVVYFKQYTLETETDTKFFFSGERKYEESYLFRKDYVLRYDDYRIRNIQGTATGCYFYRTPFYLDFDSPELENSLDENGKKEIVLNRGRVFYFDSF